MKQLEAYGAILGGFDQPVVVELCTFLAQGHDVLFDTI